MYVSCSVVTSILSHLETLKTEAAEVAKKVEETDVVMAEVETVSQQYEPLASSCSSIYFTLEALQQVRIEKLYPDFLFCWYGFLLFPTEMCLTIV